MQKRKINKKTAIIAAVLILAMIISVFAVNSTMQANKISTSANISPYKYSMVVAYVGYWKTGDDYWADMNRKTGRVRVNMGKEPAQYVEWDYWFPVATISGNYEIDSAMNLKDYKGSWSELNYSGLPEDEVRKHYMDTAVIENPGAVVGAKNTTVQFQASFKPLNPKGVGFSGVKFAKKDGQVYKCYIAIVIKYKNLDYVEPPVDPDPGSGDVMVYVEHKEKETGKSLSNLQKVKTSMGYNLILSCMDLDGYKCVSSSIKGQAEKNFSQNNIDVKVGLFDYTTPKDGYIYVTFWYEEYKEPEKPKCDPQFYPEADDARITMKRRDFEKATSIYFSNIRIAIDDYKGGYKQISGTQWDKLDGSHNFKDFDIYLKYPGSKSYDFTRHDIYSNSIYQSLNVPKIKFSPTNTEKTEYLINVEITLGVMCECVGFTAEKSSFNLYVDIVENQPPDAYYKYATKKTLPSGTETRDYSKVYIGKDTVIDNYCSDPNGLTDIEYSKFIFRNNSGQVKSIQFKMMSWGAYHLDKMDSFDDTSIIINGTDNGNLNIIFTTDEEWEVTIYVQDTEGLNDSYTEIIKPEVLSLKPTSVIKDTLDYRYPFKEEFNGKQNRVIKLDSNSSYVASWLRDMDVKIDHNKDMWQIEPLDGQDINSVKFERDINNIVSDNILNVKYEPLDIKIMFKETGKYKIRLQVSDTDGNVSSWSEQIITVNEDLSPTITADVNPIYYRNTSKIATITFNALPISHDYDMPEITDVSYKFDSNNDGNFDNEMKQVSDLSYKDVNISGVIYKQITLITKNVGKYRFTINVKENFGQETMDNYITDKDHRTASIDKQIEIDNIAPTASLGTLLPNIVDIKILTGDLTGTKRTDIDNNINNLKAVLENSDKNIKTNIEVIDVANRINGLEKGLTWKKVYLSYGSNGTLDYIQHKKDNHDPEASIFECCIEQLNGQFATGWNGLEIPSMYVRENIMKNDTEGRDKHKNIGKVYYYENRSDMYVADNYFDIEYGNNYVKSGAIKYGAKNDVWTNSPNSTAMSNEVLGDFDISFNIKTYGDTLNSEFEEDNRFFFNIKDQNNYYVLIMKTWYNKYGDKRYETWNSKNSYPVQIIQVKNGCANVIQKYHYKYDLGRYGKEDWLPNRYCVNRVVQVGSRLELWAQDVQYGGSKMFTVSLDTKTTGGNIGVWGTMSGKPSMVSMNINSLTYIKDSSLYTKIKNLNWSENSNRYIINIFEDNKINELQDEKQLNKLVSELQKKEINTVNIGVFSVNGMKLQEMIVKNQNNGVYLELGNIYNNLNAAATYIKNKQIVSPATEEYFILGSTVKYLENYSDAESDPMFAKLFKFYHLPNYFENNIGNIENNNIWVKEPIGTYNKTGKYTISYMVQDNPFTDSNLYSPFKDYRKYSNVFNKIIYVHRKPIASISLDPSFKNNVLLKQEDILATDFTIMSDKNNDALQSFNVKVPSNAINPIVSFDHYSAYYRYFYIINNNDSLDTPSQSGNMVISVNHGLSVLTFNMRRDESWPTAHISNLKLSYNYLNTNARVVINENSYDIDHKSLNNKGIVEWQWKVVDKNGATTAYNATNRVDGLNWIENTLSENLKWKDASVQLRVKDLEAAYSDWTEIYIDGDVMMDPNTDPEITKFKPIADFTLIDPLRYKDKQIIEDLSSDPEGLPLTYTWTVKKGSVTLFTSLKKGINAEINSEILKNGIGKYDVSLIVKNTKNVYSDELTKSFNVYVFNDPPTANFELVSNENPAWELPKALGLSTLKYRPSNSLFYEENARFDTYVHDSNTDNLGFIYNWKLERFAVKDINAASGTATNIYSYKTQFPFVNSFKGQGLPWGAYRITLSVTDKPTVPPYQASDAKTATVTKNYYIVPEINVNGSYESAKPEIMVGDTIKLKAKTSKYVDWTDCLFDGVTYGLDKVYEDGSFAYWEKNIVVPDTITESGTYNLKFVAKTTYGGNGNITREVQDNVPINIVALKLINFRITNIVNHLDVMFPYTKDMLINKLIPYKTGYYVTFKIDSKGKPDNVWGRVDVGNNGSIDQIINMSKVASGDTETWQGRFYVGTRLPINTVISIKLDCKKGTTIYDYNQKENWNGRSLIIDGSALMDGRINLTN